MGVSLAEWTLVDSLRHSTNTGTTITTGKKYGLVVVIYAISEVLNSKNFYASGG